MPHGDAETARRMSCVLRVLTYHRVADPEANPWLHPRLVSATPEVFARHLGLLARQYHVVSLQAVLDAAAGDVPLPRRAVLLTFDDAYRDFLDHAWPLLQQHQLPAVLFVPTAYPDDPGRSFWWDRLYRCCMTTPHSSLRRAPLGDLPLGSTVERRQSLARLQSYIKSLPHDVAMAAVEALATALGEPSGAPRAVLTWDEIRALAAAGLEIAAHTRDHPLLTRIEPERVRQQTADSLADLRRELGSVRPVFAYPSGAHDAPSVEAVRRAGVTLAFTQVDGHNDLGRTDLLRLCRTNITRRTTPTLLGLRLQRWFTWIDRWRHRQREPVRPVRFDPVPGETS
jgi:peptidoglycan/xylan/chitin deacetylase (PgdA/CDA1 family)